MNINRNDKLLAQLLLLLADNEIIAKAKLLSLM